MSNVMSAIGLSSPSHHQPALDTHDTYDAPPLTVKIPSISSSGNPLSGHSQQASPHSHVQAGYGGGTHTNSPSMSESRSKSELLLLLNGQGSLRDLMAASVGGASSGGSGPRSSINGSAGSRGNSRPTTPLAVEGGVRGNMPWARATTIASKGENGGAGVGSSAVSKGMMIAQLTRDKTLMSPSGSMYRPSQGFARTPTAFPAAFASTQPVAAEKDQPRPALSINTTAPQMSRHPATTERHDVTHLTHFQQQHSLAYHAVTPHLRLRRP